MPAPARTYRRRAEPGRVLRLALVVAVLVLVLFPIVWMVFAALRPTVERDGALIVIDDERFRFAPGERPVERLVRFRSLGCYPLSAAVLSEARSVADIVTEMRTTHISERSGRLIDQDQEASMERKKREGYF